MKLLPLIVFVSYIGFIWMKYGVQKSISDSFYRLKKTKLRFLFTFFCWGFAFPVMVISGKPMMIAAAMLICAVGVAYNFKAARLNKIVHMGAAYGGVTLAMVSAWIEYKQPWAIMLLAVIAITLTLLRKQVNYKHIWWIEIAAFLITYIVVIGG